jgi:hypothetical protein
MEYCEQHPEEISKVASVQKKVRALRGLVVVMCQGGARDSAQHLR